MSTFASHSEVERSYRQVLAAMRERAERAETERDEAIEALADMERCIDQVAYEGIAAVLAGLRSNKKGAGK